MSAQIVDCRARPEPALRCERGFNVGAVSPRRAFFVTGCDLAGEVAPPPRDWTLLAKFAREWQEPDFPVKGGDLILLGYEPGPMLGDAMDELKAHWIAERFEPTKEELLARLRQH